MLRFGDNFPFRITRSTDGDYPTVEQQPNQNSDALIGRVRPEALQAPQVGVVVQRIPSSLE